MSKTTRRTKYRRESRFGNSHPMPNVRSKLRREQIDIMARLEVAAVASHNRSKASS